MTKFDLTRLVLWSFISFFVDYDFTAQDRQDSVWTSYLRTIESSSPESRSGFWRVQSYQRVFRLLNPISHSSPATPFWKGRGITFFCAKSHASFSNCAHAKAYSNKLSMNFKYCTTCYCALLKAVVRLNFSDRIRFWRACTALQMKYCVSRVQQSSKLYKQLPG
jgi:hypothetical protein